MHLFQIDSTLNTWRLITEKLPEKPGAINNAMPGPFHYLWDEYEAKVAALKQNALTVGNEELIPKGIDMDLETVRNVLWHGELISWPGGYETKEFIEYPNEHRSQTVAILTLPEEKKNTMENLTKEQAVLILQIRDALALQNIDEAYHYLYQIASPNFNKTNPWEEIETIAASGSVAAPKEDWRKRMDALNEVMEPHGLKIVVYESGEWDLEQTIKRPR